MSQADPAVPSATVGLPSALPEVTPVQGGVPIVFDGTCVGAVGVSGVQSHEDEQIAAAGIKALG